MFNLNMFKWDFYILKNLFLFVIIFFVNNVVITSNLFKLNKNENFYHSHQNQHYQQRNHKYNLNNILTQSKQYSKYQNGKWTNVLRIVASEHELLSSKCVKIPKNFSLCHDIQVGFKIL